MIDLSKFVPCLVIKKLIEQKKAAANAENPQVVKLPDLQSMETVVIFADISGFTKLSEACVRKGNIGNETLAFCINRYMEGMV